jgi:hypothetical protein
MVTVSDCMHKFFNIARKSKPMFTLIVSAETRQWAHSPFQPCEDEISQTSFFLSYMSLIYAFIHFNLRSPFRSTFSVRPCTFLLVNSNCFMALEQRASFSC